MTKHQELEILRKTAAKLGPDSYCGPWLSRIIPEVERDIRSDFFPMHSPEEVRKEAEKLIAGASQDAEAIRKRAREHAEQIRLAAIREARETLDKAVQVLLNHKHTQLKP